jgi:hypothetical protein
MAEADHLHVFITGTTNSGTGLLRALLVPHPDMSVLMKEGHHYSPKVLPHDRRKWRRLFALRPKKFRWTEEDLERINHGKLKRQFYRRWDLSKRVLVEKSPHHMMRMRFIAAAFEPAKFVILVRDGYAVAEGIHRRRKHPIKTCAMQWYEANRNALNDAAQVDHCWLPYEKLADDPQKAIDRVCEFIGVPTVKVNLKTPIRRQNMFNRPFSLKDHPNFNAESMKRLSAEDRKVIRKQAKKILDYFGYTQKGDAK